MSEYEEIEKIQKLMEERYKIFKEIRKLTEALGTNSGKNAEKEILELLEKTMVLRKQMEKSIEHLEEVRDPILREYVTTIIDFVRLVDMDDEGDILTELVSYAKKSKGPLFSRLEWLEKEVENSLLLGRKLKVRRAK